MIWYEKDILVQEQPEQATVTLLGLYNPPTVRIRIAISERPDDTLIIKNLFSKTLSMMHYEEPTSDDILIKFNHKLVSIKKKLERTPFRQVLAWEEDGMQP